MPGSLPTQSPFPGIDLPLFRKVAGAAPDENVVLSPFSLGSAATPILLGTTGPVQAEWQRILGGGDKRGARTVAGAGRDLSAALSHDTLLVFQSANAVWSMEPYRFSPTLLAELKASYGTEARTADIRTQAGVDAVNHWAEEATRGHIPALLSQPLVLPDEAVPLVLTNGVYFFGSWVTPFETRETSPRPFISPAGVHDVPTMQRRGDMQVSVTPRRTVLWLPFRTSSGRDVGLLVVMPASPSGLSDLVERATSDSLGQWINATARRDVALQLPQLHLKSTLNLLPHMEALGLKASIRRSHAPWAPMFEAATFPWNRVVNVSAITQKATLDLDEAGVTATAATAMDVILGVTSVPPPPLTVHIDRPFLAVVLDRGSMTPLFLASVVSP